MPPLQFAVLIIAVIAAAGVTIAAAASFGLPFAALGLVALVGGLLLRLRRP